LDFHPFRLGFYFVFDITGMEVRRVLSEPTAAALAYGLHQKDGVEYIIVVDLGLNFTSFWLFNLNLYIVRRWNT
jgi:Ethanolamine utilization protein EutJ (predicted chaperonin)